ncbi:hypothetical protein GCM10027413_09400 [Conyzicola nivalis]|uniref:Uncharacterized protein n=1 Tax=Conyzicola nivalis TaxID=1477021 RepID=A0A916WJE9_9MICO|nr:hypothetical protein [Conyzicola nivalis]GGB03145.1 hypothetical protein GCM10010979_17230 [Conyzicola nivalis]
MSFSPYYPFDLLWGLSYLLVIAGIVVIAIVLVRLMLAATRALNAITFERKVRVDLMLADGDDDPDAPAAP